MKYLLTATIISFVFYSCTVGNERPLSDDDLPDPNVAKELPVEFDFSEPDSTVTVKVGGRVFTQLRFKKAYKKPVLYPILTSKGDNICRSFPIDSSANDRTDHPHHIGHWFNYGDVNGIDFWNNSDSILLENKNKYGSIALKDIHRYQKGKGRGQLEIISNWIMPDNTIILKETTVFTFRFKLGQQIIDRVTTLQALEQEVYLKDNKEGLFAIRLAKELEHQYSENPNYGAKIDKNDHSSTGFFYNSNDKEGLDCFGDQAEWVALKGKLKGKPVTIALVDHRKNPGAPAHCFTRGYGLFSYNTLGREVFTKGEEQLNFTIKPLKKATFRYRMIIKEGKALSKDELDDQYTDFNLRID